MISRVGAAQTYDRLHIHVQMGESGRRVRMEWRRRPPLTPGYIINECTARGGAAAGYVCFGPLHGAGLGFWSVNRDWRR